MENLLISTICRHDQNIFNELTKLAGKHECHVNFSQVYTLGLDNILAIQISGNWSSIAKIEAALPGLSKRLEFELIFKRGHPEKIESYFLPYKIELFAVDQPGIVYEIFDFLSSLELNIHQLELQNVTHQQTPILKMQIQVDLPADNNIADIREQFLLFCDELNIDGTLEPKK